MSFTVTYLGTNSASLQTCTLGSISIPAGSVLACVAQATVGSGQTGAAGTLVDSNSNSYTAGNHYNSSGSGFELDTFYSLSVPSSATSLTYTAASGPGTFFSSQLSAWALTYTGGTVSLGGTVGSHISSTSGTDGVTSGAITITGSDGIILGSAFDSNNPNLTVGTGFTSDGTGFSGKTVNEHKTLSASGAATWTCSASGDDVLLGAIAFYLTATATTSFHTLFSQNFY